MHILLQILTTFNWKCAISDNAASNENDGSSEEDVDQNIFQRSVSESKCIIACKTAIKRPTQKSKDHIHHISKQGPNRLKISSSVDVEFEGYVPRRTAISKPVLKSKHKPTKQLRIIRSSDSDTETEDVVTHRTTMKSHQEPAKLIRSSSSETESEDDVTRITGMKRPTLKSHREPAKLIRSSFSETESEDDVTRTTGMKRPTLKSHREPTKLIRSSSSETESEDDVTRTKGMKQSTLKSRREPAKLIRSSSSETESEDDVNRLTGMKRPTLKSNRAHMKQIRSSSSDTESEDNSTCEMRKRPSLKSKIYDASKCESKKRIRSPSYELDSSNEEVSASKKHSDKIKKTKSG